MIAPVVAAAAMLVLFISSAQSASLYRLKPSTLACVSTEKLTQAALALRDASGEEQALEVFEQISRNGDCVTLGGNFIALESVAGNVVRFRITADPRPLYTFTFMVSWSQ